MKNEESESKRLTPEELLRQIRAWLIMPSSSDGVERTAWPELVAQIDATLTTTPPATPSDAAMRAAEEISSTFGLKFQRDSLHRTAAIITRHLPATPVVTGGFTCACCQRSMELRINERFCNECAISRAAATTSPQTPAATLNERLMALPVCVKCGHPDDTNAKGICQTQEGARNWAYCLCKCEFAAPVAATAEEERNDKP